MSGAPIFAESAPAYVQAGLLPIPTGGDDGKAPLVAYAKLNRRPSASTLRAWSERWPDKNVAILAGKASGITAVDIDTKALSERDGDTLVARAIETFGDTPIKVRTPTGGLHLWYRYAGERGRNAFEGLSIDVRADGMRLLIAPPSSRPDLGGSRYKFLEGDLGDVGRLPHVKAGSLPVAKVRREAAMEPGPGQRNTRFFSRALFLIAQRGTGAALDQLLSDNADLPEPMPVDEVLKIYKSALGYEERGENVYSSGSRRVSFGTDDLSVLLANPDALALGAVLHRDHWGRHEFAVSAKAMAKAQVIPGWGPQRYRNAVAFLLKHRLLYRLYVGGKHPGDESLYAFKPPAAWV